MSVDADLLRAVTGLIFGGAAIPFAAVFISMFIAGRVITDEEDRSDLGTNAGLFFLMVGIVLVCVSILTIARWVDLHPDPGGPDELATVVNLIGIGAIVYGIYLAFQVGPILLKYIRRFWRLQREGEL